MKLKFKKLHLAAIAPKYATKGAACFDLHAINVNGISAEEAAVLKKHCHDAKTFTEVSKSRPAIFDTGLCFEVPAGHVMLIFSRSGHGFKNSVCLANAVGVIDSDYRGEIKVKLKADDQGSLSVSSGDRIAQAMIVPIPTVELEEVDELSETERGTGGFGSTGA